MSISTITINMELPERQADALREWLTAMQRERLQDEFWRDRYRYIPHAMRRGHIIAVCPDLAASVKLVAAINMAERERAGGAV